MSLMKQPKRLVLYADDDPDDLEFVRESFEDHVKDIRLITFNNAVELLRFIHTKKDETVPCLIILDVNMPGLNGKEALRLLRDMNGYEDVPVILFTTSTSPHDAGFAKSYDAGFISKPLNTRQMDMIIEKFLDRCNEGASK